MVCLEDGVISEPLREGIWLLLAIVDLDVGPDPFGGLSDLAAQSDGNCLPI